MKNKKSLTLLAAAMMIFAAVVIFNAKKFPHIEPNTSDPSEEILDYAYLSIKSFFRTPRFGLSQKDVDFILYSLDDLEEEYRKIGNIKKAMIVKNGGESIFWGHRRLRYRMGGPLQEVDALMQAGKVDEALDISKDHPVLWPRIAESLVEKGNVDKVFDILDSMDAQKSGTTLSSQTEILILLSSAARDANLQLDKEKRDILQSLFK